MFYDKSKNIGFQFWSKMSGNSLSEVQRDIYSTFFDKSGVIIIKNVYKKDLMDKYNTWCEETLEKTKNDPNARHPKQKHKYLINDLWNRMGDTDPNMLLDLLADRTLNTVQDVLLGFCKYGAATTHWIEPGGDRQVITKSFNMMLILCKTQPRRLPTSCRLRAVLGEQYGILEILTYSDH